jgi:arylsulfatase A-like enzyme
MRILFLDLDTLRPDHLGCYGYHRQTSPNIDRIAANGVRFDNYYASDAPCLPSRAALTTGRFGIRNGAVGHGGTSADLRIDEERRGFRNQMWGENLFSFLRKQGMSTHCFSSFGERHSAYWFHEGFNEIHNTGLGGMDSAEHITPSVLKWIEENGAKDDWYLHVNYWDPHTPYRAPEEFGNPFAEDPLPAWLTEEVLEQHRKKVGPHSAQDLAMWDNSTSPQYPRHPGEIKDMDDLRRVVDGYDCGIRYMDEHIGRIFAALEEAGVMDDVAVIISSDHGENQGELGIYGEHATADQITCRIPMIVRWPGGKEGHFDTGLHHNLDLLPTLCDLFDGKSSTRWDGQSFADAILRGSDCGKDYLVLSQCAHVCQRSVRFGPWLYMRTYHDGGHLFPKEMLFNLEDDPFEQNDLAEKRPEICAQGARLLHDWHDRMMQRNLPEYTDDPLWTVMREGGPFHARGMLPAYCDRLKATGREGSVGELKRRHPEQFDGWPVT